MAQLYYDKFMVMAISAAVPPRVRKTEEFIDLLGANGIERFIKNVGIRQSHIVDENMTAADLCVHSANIIINELNIDRNSIDALIFVSQTPDYVAPSTSCVIQSRLKLSDDCLAYDINLACSGFVYGISAALGYVSNSGVSRVLLLCGDTVSKHCSPYDKSLTMLSADAGSAILIEKSSNSKATASFKLKTIGNSYKSLIVPYGGYRHRFGRSERLFREEGVYRNDYDGYMNGADVFRFSITEVPKLIKEFYFENKLGSNSFSRCFLHQANLFIIKNIAKRIGVKEKDLPISIDRYGNTGAATIPLTICDHYAKNEQAAVTEKIIFCGFGIGLSLGVGIIDFENTKIFPVSICTEFFSDDIDNLHNIKLPLN
jgi:3-oxoacyl-[acyl-carrier-protein] synthase-3